jgi:excisionase family DNA binding protein
MSENTITTSRAAEILGITVRGVRDHIERGNLRALKVADMRGGAVWMVSREDVERLRRRKDAAA